MPPPTTGSVRTFVALALAAGLSPASASGTDPPEPKTLTGHTGWVGVVAFSPDGKTLATADGDWNTPSDVVLWDATTWKERGRLKHTNEVLCLAFHPTTPVLAPGARDKTVKVWDLTELPKAEK